MNKPLMPIESIGEENWITKLTNFLENYDVEVEGLNMTSITVKLPEDMFKYFENFGGIISSDFMNNLYKPADFIKLSDSKWSFLYDNFTKDELNNYIVFSENPGNDPVCFNTNDYTIHFFSHDPLKGAKVFENFNQYLKYEIIELQKLMGDVEFDRNEEIEYQREHLACSNIDYDFRYMKFC